MANPSSAQKPKVFISYSRRDSSEFAEELRAALEFAGFAPLVDRHHIAAGEDWEARLGGLIQEADTVVFVISPEAVKSERCTWEVNRALAQSKRLLPVIWKATPDADVPEQLRRRQFVRFDTGFGIARPLTQLAEALRQDIDWIREHTRLGELAGRWQARGRPESLLLRGDEVGASESWAAHRNADAPSIPDSIRAFIAASKEKETSYLENSNEARGRIIRMRALVLALLVFVIIGVTGWSNQEYIRSEWRWYTVIRPYIAAEVRPYVLSAANENALRPSHSFKECSKDCPEMIVIPAGSFMMGSPPTENDGRDYERPQHIVTIAQPFAVSMLELTFDEWDTCVTYGNCSRGVSDSGFGRGKQPVINVTFDDAHRYAAWLSQITGKTYRLLTEAEYEYAARAGTRTIYPWGDDIGKNNANCNGCGSKWDGRGTAPAGSFAPNGFGLFDMVGNVWEWLEDCFHDNYDGAPADGKAWIEEGDCKRRMVRGGPWDGTPNDLRSSNRNWSTTGNRYFALGFRIVRVLAAP
ncbi:formylglycine-generating enzyme required for sulfatase activity [Bradyrhizobium japonicum]